MSARIRVVLACALTVSLTCPAIATAATATGSLTASQASEQARKTGRAVVVPALTTYDITPVAPSNPRMSPGQDSAPPANPVITVNAPASCTTQSCTVPVRTPVNLTFSPTGTGETPAAYSYQLGVAPPVTVTATNGTWTGAIEPRQVGPAQLTVQSKSAAGTWGGSVSMWITATPVTAVDGDFTGDGHPDLVSVGNTDGLPPGLWLSPGDGTGQLGAPTDFGVNGTGVSSTGSPGDWNGAIVTHGQFMGTGEQDVLAVLPAPSSSAPQNVIVVPGSGDGSPLSGPAHDVCFTADGWDCFTNAQTITQITAVGNLPEDACSPNCAGALPDVFAVVNNQLWWFQHGSVTASFQAGVVLDSAVDWSTKQISGTTYAGQSALVVRDKNTGEIDLYANGQGANWFTGATKIIMTTSSAAADRIEAADANGDGQPDLWTVAMDGEVTFYPGIGNGQLGTPVSAGTL